MSQGRALKIPNREEPAGHSRKQREKRLNQAKKKTMQGQG